MKAEVAKLVPHTEAEFVEHVKAGCESCLVCGHPANYIRWTDYNGQSRCDCGTTYQVLCSKFTLEWLAEVGIDAKDVRVPYCDCFVWVPLLKAYHEETKRAAPFGTYLARSPIPDEDYQAFYSWVATRARELRPAWEEFFRWDDLLARYSPSHAESKCDRLKAQRDELRKSLSAAVELFEDECTPVEGAMDEYVWCFQARELLAQIPQETPK